VSSQEGTLPATVESSTGTPDIADETDGITQPEEEETAPDGEDGDTDTDDVNAANPDDTEQVGPEGTTYVVKAGDMLMKISKKFYGDENKYKLIMDANNITDPNKLAEGQTLKIPPLK
jgi:nucleoid-associated protein YgaU